MTCSKWILKAAGQDGLCTQVHPQLRAKIIPGCHARLLLMIEWVIGIGIPISYFVHGPLAPNLHQYGFDTQIRKSSTCRHQTQTVQQIGLLINQLRILFCKKKTIDLIITILPTCPSSSFFTCQIFFVRTNK